ncbi:MAG: ribose 5-phosphate isomerase B [Deltaproteobacteria bacterium]|nr:ribose 5-phosphate isomerase B [Deltaproteobacteria bacterium]
MILIASDHGGFELKEDLKTYLTELGEEVRDLGTGNGDSVDYPDFGLDLAERVSRGEAERGLLVCGTGIGMSIAANKVQGVRAALACDPYSARMAREHNDANILVIGGRTGTRELAREIARTWLHARFEGGRHARRLEKIREFETRSGRAAGPSALRSADPAVWDAVQGEIRREDDGIVLIASENYVSDAVLEAQGSVFTNKYAEGYPGHRYYGGCQFADQVEDLARNRAVALFGAGHANVQPLSGSSANMAAYYALLRPGDTILGMALAHGGHLTHGAPVSFSGRHYRIVSYGVDRDTGMIDYDEVRTVARRERPRAIVAGASSYSRLLDFPTFRAIADEVGAYLIVDMAHIAGLVAGGAHPSPIPHADVVTSTTHKTLRGPRGGLVLCRAEHAEAIDKAVFPGLQGGPLMHTVAAKAVAFQEAMTPEFSRYAHRVVENAGALAAHLIRLGYPVISGGTDNHLFCLDLTAKGLTGLDAERSLDRAGITVNKNAIPFDARGPFVTSGIRIGTPIVTTRGMGLPEMAEVGDAIARVLDHGGDPGTEAEVREAMRILCSRFPFYRHHLRPPESA